VESFYKYEALGNDFVVLDRRTSNIDLEPSAAAMWCDRHKGVGADGVLTVLPSTRAFAKMVVHNADSSVAQMCGNGLRCVVKFLAEQDGRSLTPTLAVETGAGVLECQLHWRQGRVEEVTVHMGPALLEAPILPPGGLRNQLIDGHRATAISMGNPHLVLLEAPRADISVLGPRFEHHPLFCDRTNVECVEVLNERLVVSVWERGVGLTQACGTGACAALVACALEGQLAFETWTPVELPGGMLSIWAASDRSQVLMRGPVQLVYTGTRA
jgi:diaminopimelate epimerase